MTLKEATELLAGAGIEGARDEARRIFARLGGIPQYELLAPSTPCNKKEVIDAIARRAAREPLQYILGEVDFYRESYKVTPDCLIPRSDTEILVDTAVKNMPEGARFLDLCTGSGCVALSVLNNTKNTLAAAADISDAALSVAKENAARLGLSDRTDFVLCDAAKTKIEGNFFAVLSNPPYVSESAYRGLEKEIYFEPEIAFLGGEDGGDFYRAITPMYKEVAERGGFIAYEIGYDQGELLCAIAEQNGLACEIIHDLSGNPRVALLRAK